MLAREHGTCTVAVACMSSEFTCMIRKEGTQGIWKHTGKLSSKLARFPRGRVPIVLPVPASLSPAPARRPACPRKPAAPRRARRCGWYAGRCRDGRSAQGQPPLRAVARSPHIHIDTSACHRDRAVGLQRQQYFNHRVREQMIN